MADYLPLFLQKVFFLSTRMMTTMVLWMKECMVVPTKCLQL